MGPEAVQFAGIREDLLAIGIDVVERVPFQIEWTPEAPAPHLDTTSEEVLLKNVHEFLPAAKALKEACRQSYAVGRRPLVIGGDHSMSIGSINAALEKFGDDLVVLWIDAHADVNSPKTSPSGNLHGCSLGAVVGREGADSRDNRIAWKRIQEEVCDSKFLSADRLAWIGLREVDPGEAEFIVAHPGCFFQTMQDIDHDGISGAGDAFESWLATKPGAKLWISFDVDVMDPILAPGTGTIVRGGLTYRESHYLAERLCEIAGDRIVGLDVVEVNPLKDRENSTARIAVEWVASLFGKRTLPRVR